MTFNANNGPFIFVGTIITIMGGLMTFNPGLIDKLRRWNLKQMGASVDEKAFQASSGYYKSMYLVLFIVGLVFLFLGFVVIK